MSWIIACLFLPMLHVIESRCFNEANGFWLFTRRLENGKFKFKKHEESGVLMITPQQLNWLIEGLEFENKISEDTVSNCILI